MTQVWRLLGRHLAADAAVARIVQGACFAAAPAILVVSLRVLPRFAESPSEIFLGVLSSSTIALLLVVMGLILPITERESRPPIRTEMKDTGHEFTA